MASNLPEIPDFDNIEASAEASASQRTRILALIGNLVFSWSNNESVFIYVLMILLKTDFKSATITFVTLNTTRARLDLIRRLGKTTITDPLVMKRVENLINRFNRCTKVRNEFTHSIYQLNEKGEITHTSLLRIYEKKDGLSVTTTRKLDEKRIKEVMNVIRRLKKLNRDLWDFLPVLEKHVQKNSSPSNTLPVIPPAD